MTVVVVVVASTGQYMVLRFLTRSAYGNNNNIKYHVADSIRLLTQPLGELKETRGQTTRQPHQVHHPHPQHHQPNCGEAIETGNSSPDSA